MIEGAAYPESDSQLYTGRGWVEGKFVTTHLFRDTLKKVAKQRFARCQPISTGPAATAFPINPTTSRCSVSLDAPVRGSRSRSISRMQRLLSGKPASTADGTVRGWTDRSCTKQSDGPCRGEQFDYPWSPLPAGVTECNFRALSNDPDPAGLNVRDAPDRNARVLGRLPPTDIGRLQDGSFIVRADVQVIGYRKGWFLIEAELPPTTTPICHRTGQSPTAAEAGSRATC